MLVGLGREHKLTAWAIVSLTEGLSGFGFDQTSKSVSIQHKQNSWIQTNKTGIEYYLVWANELFGMN